MNALLDTNIVVPYLAGDSRLAEKFSSASISLSVIVLGELNYGAKKSTRVQQNMDRISLFVEEVPVLAIDPNTARLFGEIKCALKLKGRPIPDNDIWIAATAMEYDLTLVSRDAHFVEVDGLRLEPW